jgi:ABC-type amino acid transport substrate-binding protein
MNEERLLRALRASGPDEDGYRPGVRPPGAPALAQPGPTIRRTAIAEAWLWPAAAAVLVIALLATLVRPTTPSPGGTPSAMPTATISTSPGQPSPVTNALDTVIAAGRLRVAVAARETGVSEARRAYAIAIAAELGQRLGVEVAIVDVPAPSILTHTDRAEWDIAFAAAALPARNHRFVVSRAYLYADRRLLVATGGTIQGIGDLSDRIVCVVTGGSATSWLASDLNFMSATPVGDPPAGVDVLALPDDAACLAAIRDGRAAAMLTSQLSGREIERAPELTALPGVLYTEPVSVIAPVRTRIDTAKLIAAIDELLGDMAADGTLGELSRAAFDGLDLSVPPPE